MKLDVVDEPGSFLISKLGGKERDAETKSLTASIALEFTTKPSFLDLYLDGHNSGAQPSAVHWRQYEGTKGLFVRYNMLEKLVLVVVDKARYHLKLRSIRPAEQEDDNYMGYREFLIGDVSLKALECQIMANACIVKAKVEVRPEVERMRDLEDLMLQESCWVSLWSDQNDLFEQPAAKPAAEPRADDDSQTDLEDAANAADEPPPSIE